MKITNVIWAAPITGQAVQENKNLKPRELCSPVHIHEKVNPSTQKLLSTGFNKLTQ